MNAVIVTIGDEILVGQTVDTNSAWIASELNLIGIPVIEILSISDQKKTIIEALDRALTKAEIVFLTGGLGPTKDDITKKVLVDYFDDELAQDPETLARIEDYFRQSNRPILEVNRQQAMLPVKAKKISNDLGTASGMWFQKDNKQIISLPGVPFEMAGLMKKILPELGKMYKLADFFHRTLLFQGIAEAQLAENIKENEDACRNCGIDVAYLPAVGLVKLRLTGRLGDITFINENLESIRQAWPQFAFGYDGETIESVIGKLLSNAGQTVSTIESCTGGALASRIVSVGGASAWFMGSVICYSNAIKVKTVGVDPAIIEKYGAVSQQTVEQMATCGRALMGTDYCMATSGIAGPDGGTPEKPVGTVWIAIASANGVTSKMFNFRHNRERNIEATVVYALNFLRRTMLEL